MFLFAKNRTGLMLSDHMIRFVTLRMNGDKTSLVAFGETVIPEGVIENGKVTKREVLLPILKTFKKTHSLKDVYIPIQNREITDMLTQAGFAVTPTISEPEALVVVLGGTGFPGRSLVVDMGMYKTGMMLVQDGEILTSTSLYFGVRGLEMIVEKMFGLSVSNAQTIVREQGIIDTPENERVSEVLLTAVSVIVAEIEKLHMEWMLEYSGEKVDAIVLLGEGALVNGFADYLGLKIRVPVMRADTWAGTTVRSDDTVPAMTYRDSLTYAVVIGLAQNSFLV